MSDGAIKFNKAGHALVIGVGLFYSCVAGDQMHILVGKTNNDGRFHGQMRAQGPWDSCSIAPNMQLVEAGDSLFPFVKCEQGSGSKMAQNTTVTVFLF